MRRAAALLAAAIVALTVVLLGTATAAARVISAPPCGVVHVVVSGFAARAPITLALVGFRSGRQRTRADLHGAAHIAYVAPRRSGDYTLLVVGVPGGVGTPPNRATGTGRRTVSRSDVVVLVPHVVKVRFRVTGGDGAEGGSTHAPPGGAGGGAGVGRIGASGGGSGLADTGTDVGALLIAAGVSLMGGAGLVLAGRRTRRSPTGRRYVTGIG